MTEYYLILLLITMVWNPLSAQTSSIKQKLYVLQKGESLGYHHISGTENTFYQNGSYAIQVKKRKNTYYWIINGKKYGP